MNMNAWAILNKEYAKFNLELRKGLSDESYYLAHVPSGETDLGFVLDGHYVLDDSIAGWHHELIDLIYKTLRELNRG